MYASSPRHSITDDWQPPRMHSAQTQSARSSSPSSSLRPSTTFMPPDSSFAPLPRQVFTKPELAAVSVDLLETSTLKNQLGSVPAHAPVYEGSLSTLLPSKSGLGPPTWKKRTVRFDGQTLVCLENEKAKPPPGLMMEHPQLDIHPIWPMCVPGLVPPMESPLLATPKNPIRYIAGQQEFVRHFQRLAWSLDISQVVGIEVLLSDAMDPYKKASLLRKNSKDKVLVLRTNTGGVRVLKAGKTKDLQRWLFVLSLAWSAYQRQFPSTEEVSETKESVREGETSLQMESLPEELPSASTDDLPLLLHLRKCVTDYNYMHQNYESDSESQVSSIKWTLGHQTTKSLLTRQSTIKRRTTIKRSSTRKRSVRSMTYNPPKETPPERRRMTIAEAPPPTTQSDDGMEPFWYSRTSRSSTGRVRVQSLYE